MRPFNVRVQEIKNLTQARKALEEVGVDETGQTLMSPKAVFRVLRVDGLSSQAANILKQEMLSLGAEAGVDRGVVNCSVSRSSALLLGTVKHFRALDHKLRLQPFGLKALADEIEHCLNAVDAGFEQLNCRGRVLQLGQRTLVMGILNVTPDSFSDGGKFNEPEAALEHALRLVEEGADILDVGAESTRPGYAPVSETEEMKRLLPVLERVIPAVSVPVSVDTSKAEVARAALERGAHIINDIWALKADPKMAGVVAEYGVPVVLMHNQQGTQYYNLMGDILDSLQESISFAEAAGILPENIIVDPGIGFGKNPEQSLEILRRLGELRSLGKPILLGPSRKSVIGHVLGLPVRERLEGTAAAVAQGIVQGVDLIRVHDVREMARLVKMMDAMVK